jgi:hypothetical protein
MAHGLSLTLAEIVPPVPVVVSEQPYANRWDRRHVVVGPTHRTVNIPRGQRRAGLNVPYRKPAATSTEGPA